jgi:hypothetical protein
MIDHAFRWIRVYLTLEEGDCLDQGQGTKHDQWGDEPSLDVLLHLVNPVLRGWTQLPPTRASKATFDYLRAFSWRRVVCWLRHTHHRVSWRWFRRRYLPGWWPTEGEVTLFNRDGVAVTRYPHLGRSCRKEQPHSSGMGSRRADA